MTPTTSFCTNCGASVSDASNFCGGCGTQTGTHVAVSADTGGVPASAAPPSLQMAPRGPLRETQAPPATPSPGRNSSRVWVLVGTLAAIAVAAIVTVVLLAGGDDEPAPTPAATTSATATADFEQQIADVFGPVLGANTQLSRSLSRLRGTNRVAAQADVRQAQSATTAAQGALGALTPPDGSDRLVAAARQVLDREVAYLSAVRSVLQSPSRAGAASVQTQGSNLMSALSAAGPSVAGDSQTITGTDRLIAWVPGAVKKLNKSDKPSTAPAPTSGGSTAAAPPATTNPYTGGRSCGDGVYAGPNTSCEFARNTKDAYYDAPGATASVRVYSPVTGTTYTMNCAPSGSGVTCSGGNSASVTF